MRIDADTLSELLESDLKRAGWDGALSPNYGSPVRQVQMQSLRKSLLKKYLPGTSGTTPETDSAALGLFLEVNERCRNWRPIPELLDPEMEVAMGEAKAFLYNFFFPAPEPSPENDGEVLYRDKTLCRSNIYMGLAPGPGSTLGTRATDLYSKLATSNLTATDQALHMYYCEAIAHHPTWAGLENCRRQRRGFELVASSRLSFVPKTTEISRTICTEPLLNMLFQKGIGQAIERRLSEVVGIHLSRQPKKNSALARIGSETGRFGTIDLKSASDSVAWSLLEYLLPKSELYWFGLARTPTTTLPGGEVIKLHMVSSMGNAFTFPLQTLLFTAIVFGAYRSLGLRLRFPKGLRIGNFGIFGDDIVVEQRAYELVVKLLHFCGFQVNVDKSFNAGDFRESCGSDYFQGCNVRGVYFSNLTDSGDLFSAINRLIRWSSRTGISLHNLISDLYNRLPNRMKVLFVPFDESDDAGLKVPFDCLPNPIIRDLNGAIRYRYRRLKVRKVKIPYDEKTVARLPDWFYNPDGVLLAVVAGSIRNGYISLRLTERQANIRVRWTPRWDFIDSAQRESVGSRSAWKRTAGLLVELDQC